MQIQAMPSSVAHLSPDPAAPDRVLLEGLYRETLQVGDHSRSFLIYLCPGLRNNRNVVVIAPPSGVSPLTWMEQWKLTEFAQTHQVFLAILEPQNGQWASDGSDGDYMNAVNVALQSRTYYVTLLGDNLYAMGFEDGCDIAHQACMKSTSQWSGLASVGQLTPAALCNVHISVGGEDRALDEAGVQGEKCPLPVWMVMDTMADSEQEAIGYWRTQNGDWGEEFQSLSADHIYLPPPDLRYSQVNEETIAQVRVTLGRSRPDPAMLHTVWAYIGAARRHRSFGRKALRYYRDVAALGAQRRTLTMDGMVREWYEYLPASLSSEDGPIPLVVCMHGRGGDGSSFFDISALNSVAEERKFLAVFPTAGLFQQRPNGVRNVTLWQEDDYRAAKEVHFLRAMVADIQSRYSIDAGRIYACGQSSGGRMASVLGGMASDLFAAVAPWSAIHAMDNPTPILPEHPMPYLILYGNMDPGIAGSDPQAPYPISKNAAAYRDALIEHLHLDPTPLHYLCGEIQYYQYCNSQGIPMLTIGIVSNMPHANYPRESWISYDEFFCKFSRQKDGTLLYMGRAVTP